MARSLEPFPETTNEVSSGIPVQVATREVIVVNPQGFHMRPKAAFAESAERFLSTVTIHWDDRIVNGKSMWDLMMVAAMPGNKIKITAQGPDAEKAVIALALFIETDLGEKI